MTRYHDQVRADQNRICPAELTDAGGNQRDLRVRVGSGIPDVWDEPVDRNQTNLQISNQRERVTNHETSLDRGLIQTAVTNLDSAWRSLSEGALCAGLANRASAYDSTTELTLWIVFSNDFDSGLSETATGPPTNSGRGGNAVTVNATCFQDVGR